jgi:hypothetical protein
MEASMGVNIGELIMHSAHGCISRMLFVCILSSWRPTGSNSTAIEVAQLQCSHKHRNGGWHVSFIAKHRARHVRLTSVQSSPS